MAHIQTTFSTIDEAILGGLSAYIQGRADEIVARAKEELEKSIREEVSKVVLQVGSFVSFEKMQNEIVIKISDQREKK